MRIEFSGVIFSPDNELNVLTQNAVGRGTTIDYVQANVGNDDGIEWFGGTVNENHIVSTATQDDNFDWQIGYTGASSSASRSRMPAIFSASGQNGFEGDNNEFGFDFLPRSNPNFCNMTMIGCRQNSGAVNCGAGGTTVTGAGALLRRGTAGKIANTIIMHYPQAGLNVQNDETYAVACDQRVPRSRRRSPCSACRTPSCYNNGGGGQVASGSTTAPNCTITQLAGLWAGLGSERNGDQSVADARSHVSHHRRTPTSSSPLPRASPTVRPTAPT